MLENPEIPDAASVLIGAGRNRVDADVLRPEIARQIPHRRLERGLRHAHDVVVREHAVAADVGQRQHAAPAALLHQRHHRARQTDERVRADVERDAKALARRFDKRIAQRLGRREAGAVHHEVEPAEFAVERRRQLGDLLVARDVARRDDGVVELWRRARGRFLRAARSDTSARVGPPPPARPARWPTRWIGGSRRRRTRPCLPDRDMRKGYFDRLRPGGP